MDFWVWPTLLLLLGTALAVMEIFVPSAGIFGFLSGVSLLAAIVLGFQHGPVTGTLILVGALVGLPTAIGLGLKYWPKTAMGRRVLLPAPSSQDVLPDDPAKDSLKGLIGRVGKAKSKLLLSGVITIDGRTIDAVSESVPVEVGEAVRVVQVRGRAAVVRPLEPGQSAEPPPDPLKRTFDDPFDTPPA